MSIGADRRIPPALPGSWDRLERAVEGAAGALAFWRRRALEAEEEVLRLRHALEELAYDRSHSDDLGVEVRRLRAENAALRSRMLEARNRVAALMRRLLTLGVEP